MTVDTEVSRRRFLRTLTMAGAAASLLPLASSCAKAVPPARAATGFVPVGKVGEFHLGEFKKVVLPDGKNVYIRKETDSTFLALSSKCTHKGCEVLWMPDAKQFKCPCHGGRYDAAGKNIAGPPPSPLPSLPTKVADGVVQVRV